MSLKCPISKTICTQEQKTDISVLTYSPEWFPLFLQQRKNACDSCNITVEDTTRVIYTWCICTKHLA